MNDLVSEILNTYPGTSSTALIWVNNAVSGTGPIKLSNSAPADGGQYLYECLFFRVPGSVGGLVYDGFDYSYYQFQSYGPVAASMGIPLDTKNSTLTATTFRYSAETNGYHDDIQVGQNDSFSPVIALPYQIALPPLLTVADWEALAPVNVGYPCTFSTLGLDGYSIMGPDFSLGRMIRITAASVNNQVVVTAWTQGGYQRRRYAHGLHALSQRQLYGSDSQPYSVLQPSRRRLV